jgi:hypothetical protein
MRSSNLWNGVVGYWSASAGPSGYRLLDQSGRNNHGTFTSNMVSTDWSADSGRWSTLHSGTENNGKQIRTAYLIPTTNFTALSWAKTTAGGLLVRLFGDAEASSGLSGVSLGLGTTAANSVYGIFRQGVNTGAGDVSTTSTFLNEVALWGVQMSANDGASVWKNGVRLAVNATYKSITQQGQGWYIGGDHPRSFFSGNIYETIIWDRVVTAAEQRQIYQIGVGGMLTPRRRRRAYSVATGLRRRLLLTGQV